MSMPSSDPKPPSFFDRFATASDKWTSKAWFFLASCLMVLIWAPSFLLVKDIDTWQLLINTPTTVITYLLVALQANTNARANSAIQKKLNALAEGVIDLLEEHDAHQDIKELRTAVGLEDKEST